MLIFGILGCVISIARQGVRGERRTKSRVQSSEYRVQLAIRRQYSEKRVESNGHAEGSLARRQQVCAKSTSNRPDGNAPKRAKAPTPGLMEISPNLFWRKKAHTQK